MLVTMSEIPIASRQLHSTGFYIFLTVHLGTTNLTHFFNVCISLRYMFRATQCSSLEELWRDVEDQ